MRQWTCHWSLLLTPLTLMSMVGESNAVMVSPMPLMVRVLIGDEASTSRSGIMGQITTSWIGPKHRRLPLSNLVTPPTSTKKQYNGLRCVSRSFRTKAAISLCTMCLLLLQMLQCSRQSERDSNGSVLQPFAAKEDSLLTSSTNGRLLWQTDACGNTRRMTFYVYVTGIIRISTSFSSRMFSSILWLYQFCLHFKLISNLSVWNFGWRH